MVASNKVAFKSVKLAKSIKLDHGRPNIDHFHSKKIYCMIESIEIKVHADYELKTWLKRVAFKTCGGR